MTDLAETVLARSAGKARYTVAIAGPPGAGKSTLAEALVRLLPQGSAIVVPMDGFHYDNTVLDELGFRERKGSPETFDYHGFLTLLQRVHRNEPDIAIPVFDRKADLARAAAFIIRERVKFIIVEGNYLLLEESPWSGLSEFFDLTIFLDVPRDELQRRLLNRWLELGYSQQKSEYWVATNDMPNVDRVITRRRSADITI